MSHPTKKLGDVVNFKVLKNSKHLPFVGMEDIESETGKFIGSKEPRGMRSTTAYFDTSSVLYGKLRPYLNKVFVPYFEGHCTTEFLPLIPDPKFLTRDWLATWLRSEVVVNNISLHTSGSRMPRASIDFLKNLEIPLPPLAEQKKIVTKIERAFAKVDEAAQLRAAADTDAAGIMTAALERVFEESKEKGWEEVTIESIADIKGGKRLPKGYNFSDVKTNHPYIRVSDFIPQSVRMTNLKYINEETFKTISRYTISKDDVYISIAGTIGVVGIIPSELDGANLTENAAKLTNLKKVDQRYLMHMLTTDSIKDQIKGEAIQTTISKLGLFRIARLKIPLPPLAEQKKIARELDVLSEKVQKLRQFQGEVGEELKELKKAVLREAFEVE